VTFDIGRASLFAAVLIILGGYVLIFRPLEATVATGYADLDAARTTLERSLALARRIPALTRERATLETQLVRLHLHEGRAATMERFLRTVAGVAGRDGVAVESVTGEARQLPPTATGRAQVPLFDETSLELGLRGQYGDVIRAVRELNGGDVATHITLASLGDADRRAGVRPQLNAAFHVLLLREADDSTIHNLRPR
jgi:hypothetical protein